MAKKAREQGPSETSIRLGERIRALRLARKLSQEQLAGLATISAKHLGEVERGKSNTSIDVLSAIASALGVKLNALIEADPRQTHQELIVGITSMAARLSEKDAQIIYRAMKVMTES